MTKFGAKKVELDGHQFASKAEADRYAQLKWLERARDIKALSVHPVFFLVVNGVTVGKFTADFMYHEGGRKVVEDVKGMITPDASLRMRVFMALFPDHELRVINRGQSKAFKQRKVAA